MAQLERAPQPRPSIALVGVEFEQLLVQLDGEVVVLATRRFLGLLNVFGVIHLNSSAVSPSIRPASGESRRKILGTKPRAVNAGYKLCTMTEPPEYEISIFPAPVLRQEALAVVAFDDDLRTKVDRLLARMRSSGGVGLAAPQVGIGLRILVLNHTGEEGDELVLVNSTIVKLSGPRDSYEEGCLSFPGIYGEVMRPMRCKIRAQTVSGEAFEAEYEGFQARVIQHEQDHLEGVLLVDRMSPADKLRNKVALDNLIHDYKQAVAKAAK